MLVSTCCQGSLTEAIREEFPLGGAIWGMQYKVQVCGICFEETEPAIACDYCGNPSTVLRSTVLGDCCISCF
jgi:hypothetical protein